MPILLILLLFFHVFATRFFIDFENGSDQNPGTSESVAWKHCPFDENAEGLSSSTPIENWDEFVFRGGVKYRGELRIERGNVSLYGNLWDFEENGRAIIDGSEDLAGGASTWTECSSSGDCGGRVDYQGIWYFSLQTAVSSIFSIPLYLNDYFVWFSQDPVPQYPFFYNRYESFHPVPKPGDSTDVVMSKTTLKDNSVLAAYSDAGAFDESFLAVWVRPNAVVVQKILSFSPSSNTITFEEISNELYDDRVSYYSIINHVNFLTDECNCYFYESSLQRVYMKFSGDPNSDNSLFEVSTLNTGVFFRDSNIVIDGFIVQKFHGDFGQIRDGIAFSKYPGTGISYNVTIRNNHIQLLRNMNGYGAIHIHELHDSTIENNHLYHCQRSSGIRASRSVNVSVLGNKVERIGRTGIYFQDSENCLISRNSVSEIYDDHGNAITLYLANTDMKITFNSVRFCERSLTYHGDADEVNNFRFEGNLWVGEAHSWGRQLIQYSHHFSTFYSPPNDNSFFVSDSGDYDVTLENNVIDGICGEPAGGDYVRNQNLFTGLCWSQDGEVLEGEGEVLADPRIFVDPGKQNFRFANTYEVRY